VRIGFGSGLVVTQRGIEGILQLFLARSAPEMNAHIFSREDSAPHENAHETQLPQEHEHGAYFDRRNLNQRRQQVGPDVPRDDPDGGSSDRRSALGKFRRPKAHYFRPY